MKRESTRASRSARSRRARARAAKPLGLTRPQPRMRAQQEEKSSRPKTPMVREDMSAPAEGTRSFSSTAAACKRASRPDVQAKLKKQPSSYSGSPDLSKDGHKRTRETDG
jgi:hypothetical protein